MIKSNQSSLDIADHLSRGEYDWCPEAETRLKEQHDLIRQQKAEIEVLRANVDAINTSEQYVDKTQNNRHDLTDEEITIVKEAVGNYVCTIKMEIDQQKQTFKGYEHCSNLPALRSELKDAEQALAILRKAQKK